jgi:hypothetical protein
LFDVVAWSFRHLLGGNAPDCRHDSSPWTTADTKDRMPNGTALPPAALLQVRGDWEYMAQAFRLRSFSSTHFCWMCNASLDSEDPLCYKDFSEAAPHRATLITHEDYLEGCALEARQPSELFKCPGLLLDHLCVDSMHAGDLGTFQDAIGSLFWVEVTHKQWHRNQRTGLIRLNEDLKRYYTANRHLGLSSIHPIHMSQIKTDTKYPILKAKAAQCRHLAEFALVLAHRHRNGSRSRASYRFRPTSRMAAFTQEHLDNLVKTFDGLTKYHRSCSALPFDQAACRQALYQYLQGLGALNDIWKRGCPEADVNKMPFHLRQKCHAMQHLASDKLALWGSPVRSWCYRDEDFVGAIKTIAQKTSHPRTLEQRVMEKLMILEGLGVSC